MTTVAVAAGAAAWEPEVLAALEHARDLDVVRRCVDVAELLGLAESRSPEVAVVAGRLPGLDLDTVRRVEQAGVRVLVVGDHDRALALGSAWSSAPGQVVAAIRSQAEREAHEASTPAGVGATMSGPDGTTTAAGRGRLLAVWGPPGAPGRSVVAMALAADAALHGARVVLVDADVQGGVQAQLLGLLDEASGLVAACREANHGSVDVARHVLPVESGLGLLSGLPRADMWQQVRRAPWERVLGAVTAACDLAVVDLGPGLDHGGPSRGAHEVTIQALEAADQLVVVGRADPVGVARLVRGLHDVGELAVPPPVVVLNRMRRSTGWDATELAGVVRSLTGHEVAAFLPDDPAALDAAAMAGRLPQRVSTSGAFVTAIRRLVSQAAAAG